MKYEESFSGVQPEVLELVKKIIPNTFVRGLREGGAGLEIPTDRDLEMKVKYSAEEEQGSVLIKILWDNIDQEEDEEEEEEEEETEEDGEED